MNKIEIGIITKPQGLKGEVRFKLNSNDQSIIYDAEKLYINNQEFYIEKIANRGGFFVLKLSGVNDINFAENLRAKKVFIDRENIVLKDDEFLVKDIIGFSIVNESKIEIGKLKDVSNFGSADIYTVKKITGGEVMFPNARDVILDIDFVLKTITINQQIFEELAV